MFGLKTQELHAHSSLRRFHNILSPISPNSINIQPSAGLLNKKRKHDDISTKEGIGGPFEIQVHCSLYICCNRLNISAGTSVISVKRFLQISTEVANISTSPPTCLARTDQSRWGFRWGPTILSKNSNPRITAFP